MNIEIGKEYTYYNPYDGWHNKVVKIISPSKYKSIRVQDSWWNVEYGGMQGIVGTKELRTILNVSRDRRGRFINTAIRDAIAPIRPNVKPCPCCGSANLYTGPASSNSSEVHCMVYVGGCGMRMIVSGDEIPMRKGDTIEGHNQRILNEAIIRWNKRQ